jgi:hypothetical protein
MAWRVDAEAQANDRALARAILDDGRLRECPRGTSPAARWDGLAGSTVLTASEIDRRPRVFQVSGTVVERWERCRQDVYRAQRRGGLQRRRAPSMGIRRRVAG